MKQAVVLAAGCGSRLGPVGHRLPKCLQPVGDRTLLDIQLDILERVRIEEVCVVVGHESERVRQHLANRPWITTIENRVYAETNSLYSLWLAREWVRGPFLCLNGDVIAHPDVFHRVLAVEGSALAFDSTSGREEEHMKVAAPGGFLAAISKSLSTGRVQGESVGLLQFDAPGALRLLAEVSAMVANGGVQNWVPAAVDRIAAQVPIRCVDVGGLPWVEVDFPEDLDCARSRVWPSIAHLVGAGARAAARDRFAGSPTLLQIPHAI